MYLERDAWCATKSSIAVGCEHTSLFLEFCWGAGLCFEYWPMESGGCVRSGDAFRGCTGVVGGVIPRGVGSAWVRGHGVCTPYLQWNPSGGCRVTWWRSVEGVAASWNTLSKYLGSPCSRRERLASFVCPPPLQPVKGVRLLDITFLRATGESSARGYPWHEALAWWQSGVRRHMLEAAPVRGSAL